MWDKQEKKLTPPDVQVLPKKELVKAQDSLIITNPSAEASPTASVIKEGVV